MSVVDRVFPKQATPTRSASVKPAPLESDLPARRATLQREFAECQWNLGGVAYEMAIRDHFRLDVLVRLAARLQEVDAELGEVERLLRLERGAAAGDCPSCGVLYGRGAVYCWQCGANLMPHAVVATDRLEA